VKKVKKIVGKVVRAVVGKGAKKAAEVGKHVGEKTKRKCLEVSARVLKKDPEELEKELGSAVEDVRDSLEHIGRQMADDAAEFMGHDSFKEMKKERIDPFLRKVVSKITEGEADLTFPLYKKLPKKYAGSAEPIKPMTFLVHRDVDEELPAKVNQYVNSEGMKVDFGVVDYVKKTEHGTEIRIDFYALKKRGD
jgi:hypothetical protein